MPVIVPGTITTDPAWITSGNVTIVGPSPQWADNSDASYVQLYSTYFGANTVAYATADSTQLQGLPTGMTVHVRASCAGTEYSKGTARPRLFFATRSSFDPGYWYSLEETDWRIDINGAIRDYSFRVNPIVFGDLEEQEYWRDYLAGALELRIGHRPSATVSTIDPIRIYNLGVEFHYAVGDKKYTEGFETGPLGGIVTGADTSFYEVNTYDLDPINQYSTLEERNTVRHSSDAYRGYFSATIPPELVVTGSYNGTNHYYPLSWLGGDNTINAVIEGGRREFEWYFKYAKNSADQPFFGRYLYELGSDILGKRCTDSRGYPTQSSATGWYTGVETDIHRVYTPPDIIWRQTTRDVTWVSGGVRDFPVRPPRDTWLKVYVDWTGNQTVRTVITHADDGTVYWDFTETVTRPNQGLAYLSAYLTTTRTGTPGYDCQFWIDGDGPLIEPVITGRPDRVRRRFIPVR